MLKLEIDDILNLIENEKPFSAISVDGAFLISIEEYVPYVCCAIHNGGNFRANLRDKIALTKMDRWMEEDSHTWQFIASLPIRVIVYDSRYEYDLNRSPNSAIYEDAWGKKVWKSPLTEEEKELSLKKHANFYRVIHKLVEKLESKFDGVLVYDIHSYNYKRGTEDNFPVFNLGTEKLSEEYRKSINKFLKELKTIELDPIVTTVEENGVFYGRGYLLEYVTDNFKNTLVFATEIKKVYVDEVSGDEYPEIVEKIRVGLKRAIVNTSYYFVKNNSRFEINNKYQLLASLTEDTLKIVDEALFNLLQEIEVLNYVNPMNIEHEKKRFFASKYRHIPEFKYKPIPFDTNEMKRKLYDLPTAKIKDISCKNLYEDIIESYINKMELLTLRGKKEFLYSSLKYFGEPTKVDIENAKYLLHSYYESEEEENLTSSEVKEILNDIVKDYGFKCNIKLVKNLSAKAMVVNATKTVNIRKDAKFAPTYAKALAHHEVGVHMVTTINASKQPLKLLRLGTPNNTKTQEGLAILSEHLAGFLTIGRLKELALRVVAVNLMVRGYEFNEVFEILIDKYKLSEDEAFYLATRIFRGGGFTKDWLYLKGFHEILELYNSGKDLSILFSGKTSIEYKSLLDELVEREIIRKPIYEPISFKAEKKENLILDYLLKGLK